MEQVVRDQIRTLYSTGLSTRKVSELTGISKSQVFQVCQDIKRSKSEALIGRWLKESTHWRTLRARARQLMQIHLGRKLNKLEYVHHIDGDPSNNSIENLEVMTASDHGNHHHPKLWNIPRWEIPARREYQRIYQREYRKRQLIG